MLSPVKWFLMLGDKPHKLLVAWHLGRLRLP